MRRSVIEVRCDRCARTSFVEEPEPNREPVDPIGFSAILGGRNADGVYKTDNSLTLQFHELCASCEKTIRQHLEACGAITRTRTRTRRAKAPPKVGDLVDVLPEVEAKEPGAKKKSQAVA